MANKPKSYAKKESYALVVLQSVKTMKTQWEKMIAKETALHCMLDQTHEQLLSLSPRRLRGLSLAIGAPSPLSSHLES